MVNYLDRGAREMTLVKARLAAVESLAVMAVTLALKRETPAMNAELLAGLKALVMSRSDLSAEERAAAAGFLDHAWPRPPPESPGAP